MGFDINSVRLLIKAKQLGVNFEKTITIGRQGLHLKKKELMNLLLEAGLDSNDTLKSLIDNNYSESFLKLLGSKITDSIDASEYEGATIVHDMNIPISNDHKSKYTLVIDGGSLEHIFNFPNAIKNCMELIEENGYYIGITPSNNFFGHGFYQFSPELYYRIFNDTNGFIISKMYFFIDDRSGKASIFEVSDPLLVKQRVTLVNSKRSYLFIIAQKKEEKELFSKTPQQSDYEHISWKNEDSKNTTKTSIPISSRFIRQIVGSNFHTKMYKQKRKLVKLYNRLTQPIGDSNPSFFKKIDKSVAIENQTESKKK